MTRVRIVRLSYSRDFRQCWIGFGGWVPVGGWRFKWGSPGFGWGSWLAKLGLSWVVLTLPPSHSGEFHGTPRPRVAFLSTCQGLRSRAPRGGGGGSEVVGHPNTPTPTTPTAPSTPRWVATTGHALVGMRMHSVVLYHLPSSWASDLT